MSEGSTGGGAAPAAPSTPSAPSTSAASPAPSSAPAVKPTAPANTNASEAPAKPANDNATPAEPRYKVRVRGQERELSMAELTKLAEKGGGAEEVYREAAQLRKRISEDPLGTIAELKGDKSTAGKALVRSLLADPDVRRVLEQEIVAHYEYEGLPEDERRRVDEDRQVRAKAQRADEYERQIKAQQVEQRTAHYQRHLSTVFTRELTALGVPVDSDSLGWMAFYTERALETQENVTPAQLAERVKAKVGPRQPDIKTMTAEQLEALLSEEQRAGLRARDVERLKAATPVERVAPPRAPNGRFAGSNDAPKAKPSTSAFFARLRGER